MKKTRDGFHVPWTHSNDCIMYFTECIPRAGSGTHPLLSLRLDLHQGTTMISALWQSVKFKKAFKQLNYEEVFGEAFKRKWIMHSMSPQIKKNEQGAKSWLYKGKLIPYKLLDSKKILLIGKRIKFQLANNSSKCFPFSMTVLALLYCVLHCCPILRRRNTVNWRFSRLESCN